MITDKKKLLPDLREATLELGCGNRRRIPGSITVDAIDYDCVDLVGEIFEVLAQVPESRVSRVFSSHFFEHIEDVPRLMSELARIIRPQGMLETIVPHFSNPYFHSDLTHHSRFGLYTFSYLVQDALFKRKVPCYATPFPFCLNRVRLVFKSPPPFYSRYVLKKIPELFFNLHRGLQEFYEENLCYLFPCYEIHFELIRLPDASQDGNRS